MPGGTPGKEFVPMSKKNRESAYPNTLSLSVDHFSGLSMFEIDCWKRFLNPVFEIGFETSFETGC
jgi:hypothetical protein